MEKLSQDTEKERAELKSTQVILESLQSKHEKLQTVFADITEELKGTKAEHAQSQSSQSDIQKSLDQITIQRDGLLDEKATLEEGLADAKKAVITMTADLATNEKTTKDALLAREGLESKVQKLEDKGVPTSDKPFRFTYRKEGGARRPKTERKRISFAEGKSVCNRIKTGESDQRTHRA